MVCSTTLRVLWKASFPAKETGLQHCREECLKTTGPYDARFLHSPLLEIPWADHETSCQHPSISSGRNTQGAVFPGILLSDSSCLSQSYWNDHKTEANSWPECFQKFPLKKIMSQTAEKPKGSQGKESMHLPFMPLTTPFFPGRISQETPAQVSFQAYQKSAAKC